MEYGFDFTFAYVLVLVAVLLDTWAFWDKSHQTTCRSLKPGGPTASQVNLMFQGLDLPIPQGAMRKDHHRTARLAGKRGVRGGLAQCGFLVQHDSLALLAYMRISFLFDS